MAMLNNQMVDFEDLGIVWDCLLLGFHIKQWDTATLVYSQQLWGYIGVSWIWKFMNT